MTLTTIVIGAGSAGGVIAARLSEDPQNEVVLIEAGPDYPTMAQVPDDLKDAGDMSQFAHDWGLAAHFVEPPEAREPQRYPRGRVVGGSSCVNAAVGVRPAIEDYRRWADDGATEWGWDAVGPVLERIERDLDFGERPGHGAAGLVPIMRSSRSEWPAPTLAFEQACVDRGFAAVDDLNAPGATGIGPTARNMWDGIRASTLVTYLHQARGRENLTILGETTCRRILFDGNRATGIEVERDDGRVERIDGDRIVLSAGAIHSPQILTLSGIGRAESLAALGIEPVSTLEGVGRNLQDHPNSSLLALMKPTEYRGARAVLKFTTQNGKEHGEVDDFMLFACVLEPETLNLEVDVEGRQAFTLVNILAKPHSIGWLDIVSPDHRIAPEIHLNYLGDERDMARMKEGMRLAFEVATSAPLDATIDTPMFPEAETVHDDDLLEAWLREAVSCAFHAACTCAMGADPAKGAVVDQHLAVHGVENLWVADASVMPTITTGVTNIATYLIGERMAEMLRQGVAV
jgi:choline dehydrogenase